MWFRLPEGCGGITVERQEFSPEFRDDDGNAYFRAPDHFAPRILEMKGFAVVETPPGAPDDLPKADPLRDGAISELTRTVAARDIEIQNLRSDLGSASARIIALTNEKADLQRKLDASEQLVEGLREELEDKPAVETKGKTK